MYRVLQEFNAFGEGVMYRVLQEGTVLLRDRVSLVELRHPSRRNDCIGCRTVQNRI